MDNSNPYLAPASARSGSKPARAVPWGAVLGYGFALFVAGVAVGALTPPGSLLVGFALSFVAQASVLAVLAYRHAQATVICALLAICVEWALGWAANAALEHYAPTPAEPAVLYVIGWAITFIALTAGTTIGSVLRRRHGGGA